MPLKCREGGRRHRRGHGIRFWQILLQKIPSLWHDWFRRRVMMGQLKHGQEQLFYEFQLDEVVPDDQLVREIAAVLDLSWVRAELASYYSPLGRPSIDPVLMVRMRLRFCHPLGAVALSRG